MTAALKMPCKGEHADAEEIVVSMFNARRQRGEMVTAEWLASTKRDPFESIPRSIIRKGLKMALSAAFSDSVARPSQ
jgi:hypothetical protein